MRSALITTHDTLEEVEKEINLLLDAQPDAQIVSVIPTTRTTWYKEDKTCYKLVTIRNFNGFKD